jgi:hypothetical protein
VPRLTFEPLDFSAPCVPAVWTRHVRGGSENASRGLACRNGPVVAGRIYMPPALRSATMAGTTAAITPIRPSALLRSPSRLPGMAVDVGKVAHPRSAKQIIRGRLPSAEPRQQESHDQHNRS